MDKETWFTKLYDSHADAIWRYFMVRLANAERANELTHDTFLRVWEVVTKGDIIEYERTYLYVVAKRLFLNEIRNKKIMTSLDDLTEIGFDIPDTEVLPDRAAEHQELWQNLSMILPSYQEVLILRYVDGLPVNEIAKLLEVQETNVSMRIKRGIDALLNLYQKKPHTT
ncbi:MAG: RNA polymerase sigma factor [Candidatus Paceibacteria bacterium]